MRANEVRLFDLLGVHYIHDGFWVRGLAGEAFCRLRMVPLATGAFLSLLVQRKEPKKHAPGGTPCALRRVRERSVNFRKAHPCAIRKRRPSGAAPFGFYPAHPPCLMGTPKSRSNRDASALALGPPEVRQSRRVQPQRGAAQGCAAFSYGARCPARKFPPGLRTSRWRRADRRGVLSFAYFSLHKQRKVGPPRRAAPSPPTCGAKPPANCIRGQEEASRNSSV